MVAGLVVVGDTVTGNDPALMVTAGVVWVWSDNENSGVDVRGSGIEETTGTEPEYE